MFKFIKTPINDLMIIEPQVFGDERGFFMETYNKDEFHKNGITSNFIQDNHSKSDAGVLRGLHFQLKNTQAKLVRVICGRVYDVAVDLRKNSPTYKKWFGIILSSENKKQLFIPKGFAHGFVSLENNTEFVYKCDARYNPKAECGVIWNDSSLNIDWNKYIDTATIQLSKKDLNNISIGGFEKINPF